MNKTSQVHEHPSAKSTASSDKHTPSTYYRTLVKSGHVPVNGFEMYYEVHGAGPARPLVTIHPVLGTASVFPSLARNRQLVALELQGHGRSTDLDRPLTFEQEADDVAALLTFLKIEQADFFGESAGGVVALMMAVRHPALVGRVVTYGAAFAALTGGRTLPPDAYPFQFQREGFERVAPDPKRWPALFAKVLGMQWEGFSGDELRSINVPVLIASGDHDFGPVERSLETVRLIPNAQLAIIPGASHFVLSSDPEKLLSVVAAFLDEPATEVPFGTPLTGYHPGTTR